MLCYQAWRTSANEHFSLIQSYRSEYCIVGEGNKKSFISTASYAAISTALNPDNNNTKAFGLCAQAIQDVKDRSSFGNKFGLAICCLLFPVISWIYCYYLSIKEDDKRNEEAQALNPLVDTVSCQSQTQTAFLRKACCILKPLVPEKKVVQEKTPPAASKRVYAQHFYSKF